MTADQPSAPSSSTATAESRRQLEEWAEAKRAARLEKAKEAQPKATALTSGAPTSEAAPAPTAAAAAASSKPPSSALPPASSMSIASLREELLTKHDASVVLGAGDDRPRLVAALEASRRSQGRAGAACILSGRGGGPAPAPDAVRGASWEGAEEEAEATAAVEGEVLEEGGGPATTAGRAPGDGRDVEEGVPPTASVFDGGPAPRPTPAGHPPHVRDDHAKHNDDGKQMGVIILVLLVLSFVLSFVPGGIVPYIAGVCSIVALVLVSSIACKCCCAVSYDLQWHVERFIVGALLSLVTSFILSIVGAVIVVNNNSEITPGVMALVVITLVLNVFAIVFTALFVWGRDSSLDPCYDMTRSEVRGSLSARAAPIDGNADSPGEDGPEVAEERWAKRHRWKIVGGAVLAVGAVAVALGVAFGTGGSEANGVDDEGEDALLSDEGVVSPSNGSASPSPSFPPTSSPSFPPTRSLSPSTSGQPTMSPSTSGQPSMYPRRIGTAGDCVALDPNPDDFEDGTFPLPPWSTGGDGEWAIATDTVFSGANSLRSPDFDGVAGSATSNATLQVCDDFAGGTLTFQALASVLPPSDIFVVYVDGESAAQLVGVYEWTEVVLTLSPGPHRVDFSYQYNIFGVVPLPPSPPDRQGAVWIDAVELQGIPASSSSKRRNNRNNGKGKG